MAEVFGAITIMTIAYFLIKSAVKNAIIEAHKYINEYNKDENETM